MEVYFEACYVRKCQQYTSQQGMVVERGKVPIVPSISIRKDFQRKKRLLKTYPRLGGYEKKGF